MKEIRTIIYTTLKPYFWNIFWVFFLMMVVVGLEAVAPWPFKFLVDNVLEENKPTSLQRQLALLFPSVDSHLSLGILIVFFFFLTSLALSLTEYFKSYSLKKVIKNIIFDFSKVTFHAVEKFSMGFYRSQEIGDYIYRLNYDVSALGDLIETVILPMCTSILYLIVTTIIMFFINIKLTLLSLLVLPFLIAGLLAVNKNIVRVSKKSEHWNSAVFSFIQEVLSQLKVVQAFSQEKREAVEYNQKIETSLITDLQLYKLNFLLALLVGVIIAISYSLIIGQGISDVFNGIITTGFLIVFIFYLDNLTAPIIEIIYAISSFKEHMVRIRRLNEFFADSNQTADTGKIEEIIDSTIEFKNVNLVAKDGLKILDNISFTIEKGKTTVIVGISGSGKSSIISLIPRLIDEPHSGKIFIGGRNIKDYSLPALRKNIAFVPQEIFLFNETIKTNIAFGNPHAPFKDIEEVAKFAAIDNFITRHVSGYEFHVGEGGNYLSGGQRQRVMLARALLTNAKIMIFDEIFSAQDLSTRKKILDGIKKIAAGKTIIMVSNILEIIYEADHIIVVNDGKIVDSGQHLDLLERSKDYKLLLGVE